MSASSISIFGLVAPHAACRKLAAIMKTGLNAVLDPTRHSNEALEFETTLRRKIVGQDPAVEKVAEIYQMFLAGLNPPGRPVGNLLFLGPTGSGKTRVVEAMAESLFGDTHACIKIDCAEFQHSHEIAKLIGSPPGYLGHRETHPLLTQEALNQWHTERLKLSILLFDEIEKASDALWQLLLGILDKATLTLGDNRRVDLSQCVIVMTSNLGAAEMNEMINGTMGFAQTPAQMDARLDQKIDRTAVEAARRKFSPEFMNRIDKVVVFRMLRCEHLEQILEIELGLVQQRILQATGNNQFVFSCTLPVKQYLLREGTDLRYGARHLKRAIERNIVFPLANLVATSQVKLGDFIRIDVDSAGKLTFVKEAEGALVPVLLERYGPEATASAAAAGKSARNVSGRVRELGTAGDKK
jgi:ATP-dependent Clp protease ATP-binding subunit ClpA